MRIALTSVHCWPGTRRGGERYLHELAAALLRAGHEPRILSTGQGGRAPELDVPVVRLPERRLPGRYPVPWGNVAVERAFGWQTLAHLAVPAALRQVDIWHALSTSDAAAAAAVGLLPWAPRTVFTDHGFPAAASRRARPDRREHAFVVRHIDDYVCVSHAAAGYLSRDYGRPARVVPPGVRFAAYAEGPDRRARPTLLYSGALNEPRKNVALLLEAVDLLLRWVPDIQVWLLGPGNPDPLLAAAPPAAREAVTKSGPVDDAALRTAYSQAWVTVLPSYAESFGMSVLESLASGTPAVVLTDGGGPAEIVSDDRLGRRCLPTAESLATACAEALTLATQQETAAACRQRAQAYDWDAAIVPRLLAVYRTAAN